MASAAAAAKIKTKLRIGPLCRCTYYKIAARADGKFWSDCEVAGIAEAFLGRVCTEATGGALTLVGRFGVR